MDQEQLKPGRGHVHSGASQALSSLQETRQLRVEDSSGNCMKPELGGQMPAA